MRPLIVHLNREHDALCVVQALGPNSAAMSAAEHGWDVEVDLRSQRVEEALTAVHDCLRDNAIPFARVTVAGQTYAMEPTPTT